MGHYVRLHTQYGYHEGVIQQVTGNQVFLMSPRRYIPTQFVSEKVSEDDEKRLDLALVFGGYGGYGGRARGYGRYPGYGGYGGYGYGWGRWAVSFLAIYALWGLFFW